ncbi:MAG: DNA polymerase III subunit delta [Bacteroidota bacterium]
MTYKELLQSINKKEFQPVYLLHGEEAYYIDQLSSHFEEKALEEHEKAFNQIIIYGKEAQSKSLIDAACRYPMMAARQLVILKEAQEMRTLGDLKPYIEKPVPTTIFVICYKHKKFDKRTALAKALKKSAVIFESKRMYDNKMPGWISDYLKTKKLGITPEATRLVAEYLGTNLSKVANELDKLAINIPSGSTINDQQIQDQIGISKEYNVFELQNALGQRNTLKANRIINYFISNPKKNPLVVVIASLYNYFSKVYMLHFLRNSPDGEVARTLKLRSDYFLKDYKMAARNFRPAKTQQVINLLKEYDLRSKGVENNSASEGELMKELVYRILH